MKKRVVIVIVALLILYMSLYTWNVKSGVIDRLAASTGLEFTVWVLAPGHFVHDRVTTMVDRYVWLVGLREENDRLRAHVQRLTLANAGLREEAAQSGRLRGLLGFAPPRGWSRVGARVVSHEMGPMGVLETITIDRGSRHGLAEDQPVLVPGGVVGSVLKPGLSGGVVMLITDPNSRVAVLGDASRTTGVLAGRGPGTLLTVEYVPLNAPLAEGELLVTSGLGSIFPKGIPAARVVSITRDDTSLFQRVLAEPLVPLRDLEEVLVLSRRPMDAEQGQPHARPDDQPSAQLQVKPQAADDHLPLELPATATPQGGTAARAQAGAN